MHWVRRRSLSQNDLAPAAFYNLRAVTASAELRMARTDADFEKVRQAVMRPIHDPTGVTPFANNWTGRPPLERASKTEALLKTNQSGISPQAWNVEMNAFIDGDIVGGISLRAENFAVLRLAEIGLWVSFEQQSQGIGRQIVCAALSLAFDHWGTLDVFYTALHHNARSLGLSERLGFEPNGFNYLEQDGQRQQLLQRVMTKDHWIQVREDHQHVVHQALEDVEITGADECLPFLVLS